MIATFTLRFLRYLSFWTTGCVFLLQWRLMMLFTDDGHNNPQLLSPSTIEKPTIHARIPVNHTNSDPRHVVFYHTYVPRDRELPIVREQMAQIAVAAKNTTISEIVYTVIGNKPLNATSFMKDLCPQGVSCRLGGHYMQGHENITLALLHAHCRNHPKDLVSYLHTKGSFNAKYNGKVQAPWRRSATRAALHPDCVGSITRDYTSTKCNVCALQIQHFGFIAAKANMWTARCDYVTRLHPIDTYTSRQYAWLDVADQLIANGTLTRDHPHNPDSWLGQGRYAFEHWIGGHPDFYGCDLSSELMGIRYWIKKDRPWEDLQLSVTPRHELLKIPPGPVRDNLTLQQTEYFLLPGQIRQWQYVYNGQVPPIDSWVWKWFPHGQEWFAKFYIKTEPDR